MIVVADDFGADEGTNTAIAAALDAGLVDAASVLANGSGFAEAAELGRSFAGRVGVHLVLTEGAPLTEAMRGLPRFCDGEGRYRLWRGPERALRLGVSERLVVAAELRAQVEAARRSGLVVSHLDSHHHVHTEPALASVVIALAHEFGIGRVRLARNCGAGMGLMNRAWKAVFNARLRRSGLAGTRWFGGVDDYRWLNARRADVDSFELMVHPVPGPAGVVDGEHADVSLAELLVR